MRLLPITLHASAVLAVACLAACNSRADKAATLGTPFAAGRVLLDIPSTWSPWSPPANIAQQMGPRPGATWYAYASSSLRLLISRDEDLRQDSLPGLCDPPKGRDAEQLARVGAKLISRSMVRLDGLSFCRAETISKTAVTVHHLGVVEGRAFAMVFFFDEGERSASSAAIKALVTSFRYQPTVDGSHCNPDAERAMCFDDKHMAVCREGRWKFTDCDQACATNGGPGDGCMFMSEQNRYACVCGQVAP